MMGLNRSQTHKIHDWSDWVEICVEHEIDPYENVDIGIDRGGGTSLDLEYTGDIPDAVERIDVIGSDKVYGVQPEFQGDLDWYVFFLSSYGNGHVWLDARLATLPDAFEYIQGKFSKWDPSYMGMFAIVHDKGGK